MYENENETYTAYQEAPVYTGASENGGKGKKQKEPRQKGRTWRKVLLSVCMGLCFGVFAGFGFYAVQFGTGRLTGQEERGREDEEEVDEDETLSAEL